MHITMPDGTTPLIGDDDGGRMLPVTTSDPDDFRGSLAVGASLFDRGEYRFVAGGPSEEVFWLLGPDRIAKYHHLKQTEPTTSSVAFPDGGYCVMREGWEDTDNCLVVDCGEVGSLAGGHGHAEFMGPHRFSGRRHADGVGPQRLQRSDLRRGFVDRSGHRIDLAEVLTERSRIGRRR